MLTFPFKEPGKPEIDQIYLDLVANERMTKVRVGEKEAWLVTGYEEVRQVLTDPRFSRSDVDDEVLRGIVGPAAQRFRSAIGMMEPGKHARLRRLVVKALSARRVEAMRPRAQALAGRLLDEMAEKGQPADIIERFALPFPLTMICDLLGVPFEDRVVFQTWADSVHATTALPVEAVRHANERLVDYMTRLVAERYAEPKEDLLSGLVLAREADDRLTEHEIAHLGVELLVAGHETTTGSLSNFIYILLAHPGHMRWAVEHPGKVPQMVEELLRFVPLSGLTTPSTAMEDVEVGGITVCRGESVLPARIAANRDERAFPNANSLDFERADNQHFTFSFGAHHCVGAPMARMELQVAIAALAARFPGLRLAVEPDEVSWKSGKLLTTPAGLPVCW